MKLKEIITPAPEVVHPEAPIAEAARKMESLNVGMLPVCDGDRLVGSVTDRDITIRATARGGDPNTVTVREVMTPEIIYCFEDQNIEEAAELMEKKQIRRLPVLNRNKRLVGIVSLGDLAIRTHEDHLAGEVLERVSEPAPAVL